MSVHISEFNVFSAIGGGDFVEVAAPAGTDVSGYSVYIYLNDGTIFDGPFSLGTADATIDGKDVYLIDAVSDGIDISTSKSIALIDDGGDVVQFIAGNGNTTTAIEGPAAGETSTNVGWLHGARSMQSDDGGATYYQQANPNPGSIPCFASGTVIETPSGHRAIETLNAGDLVTTPDAGPVEIVWASWFSVAGSKLDAKTVPVLIREGALGHGRPTRDLIVSQQHRILVGEAGQLTPHFSQPALVPAKALISLPGIRLMHGCRGVVWHHFAFRRHGLVTSAGAVSESCFVGPMVIGRLPHDLTQSHQAQPGSAWNGPACRPCLSVSETRARLRRSPGALRIA